MTSKALRSTAPTGPLRLLLSIFTKQIAISPYPHSQIFTTVEASSNVMAMVKKSSISLETCSADVISSSDASLNIKCKLFTRGDFSPQAEIRKGHCKDFRSEPKINGDVQKIINGEDEECDDGGTIATKIVTTTFRDEDSLMLPPLVSADAGDDDEQHETIGPFRRSYCVRCDLFYGTMENERMSLVAKWFDVTVSYNGIGNTRSNGEDTRECFGAIEEECFAGEEGNRLLFQVSSVETEEFLPKLDVNFKM
ncbi:hypothetical protein ACHAXS_013076 [Conticribra weissflogii]